MSTSSSSSSDYEKASTIGDLPLSSDLSNIMADLQKFSSSSSSKNILKDMDLERKREKFVSKLSPILQKIKALSPTEDQLRNVTLFLLQSLEDYIYSEDAEKCALVKNEIATELLKPFLNGDDNLTKQIINIVADKVKPSTLWRRNKKMISRISRIFF